MWLLKAAQVRSYKIRYSFDSGCLADSALQHQTHFNLSCIGPRLDRNRLAAGAAAGEHISGVANDWHASNSFLLSFLGLLQFLGVIQGQPTRIMDTVPIRTFIPVNSGIGISKLV